VFSRKRQHAEDALHPQLTVAAVDVGTQGADLASCVARTGQQLSRRLWRPRRLVSLGVR
jgi:hypothetical protein